jgi:tRNA dimethylallyltransferase
VVESDEGVRAHDAHDAAHAPPIAVLCGPTAAGKSALALAFARTVPTTIISADSRQIYRGFDLGTAKPTREELALVPHAGVDVADPTERWSAWQWASMARRAIEEARDAGRVPLVVGGTGFYIRALVTPLAPIPPLDARARASLAHWLDTLSPDELQRWCARLDTPRAALGPTQWRRAVEVALLTGVPLSVWHAQSRPLPPLAVRYLVVDREDRHHLLSDLRWLRRRRDRAGHRARGVAGMRSTSSRTRSRSGCRATCRACTSTKWTPRSALSALRVPPYDAGAGLRHARSGA